MVLCWSLLQFYCSLFLSVGHFYGTTGSCGAGIYIAQKGLAPHFFMHKNTWPPSFSTSPPSLVIGESLSEPHNLVAHRGQAQCIMVRSLYVRTRNFSYSDLNPTGFSPRTGYFENFQSLYCKVIYSKFYGPFASHRLTIFHAMKCILHAK
jgi:hypothetical protein